MPRSVYPATLTNEWTVPNSLSVSSTIFLQSSTLDKSAFTYKHLEPKSSISFFISAPLFSCLPQIVIAFAPLAAKSFAVSAPLPWVLPVTIITFPSNCWDWLDI